MGQSWWQLDWVWAVTGWTLAGVGGVVLIWALFWDRARGRRRCPKCWYDMAGVPGLKCPECGRIAKRERVLTKTRRRWSTAIVGIAVGAIAWVAVSTPQVQMEGWTGLAPTPVLSAVVIFARDRKVPPRWPQYLRKETSTPDFSLQYPTHPLNHRVARWCAGVVAARAKRGAIGARVREVCYRIAWKTLDSDLNRYPPVADEFVKDLLYALSTDRYPQRSQRIAPLAAPYFEVMPNPIAGSPVYAMVQGEGIGDQEAHIEVATEWGSSTRLVTMHTAESSFLIMMISTPGITYDEIISLGVPPEGVTSVKVTTKVRRNMQGSWRDPGPVLCTRSVVVPINVRPRSQDPLVSVEAELAAMQTLVRVSLTRDFYEHAPQLDFRRFSRFEQPAGSATSLVDVTLGARAQLLDEDRQVLFEGEVCLWDGQVLAVYPWVSAFGSWTHGGTVVTLRPRNPTPPRGIPATVRLIGDADIARQNPYCTKYFRGTWELPVEVTKSW